MANLIIKSSADNLVLQGSDASPAITVGATGTTTFAENASFTTGNIGTLTSATTFPAGHVLQVVHTVKDSTFSDNRMVLLILQVYQQLLLQQVEIKF